MVPTPTIWIRILLSPPNEAQVYARLDNTAQVEDRPKQDCAYSEEHVHRDARGFCRW